MNADRIGKRPGRPRAIPEGMIPELICLYHEGFGYRAVARELSKVGVWADWSTVRRIIKSHRYRSSAKYGLQNDF
jgi:hypothetical protein